MRGMLRSVDDVIKVMALCVGFCVGPGWAYAAKGTPKASRASGSALLISEAAAKELRRWLAPLGYKKGVDGLKLINRLKTGGRKRWGLTISNKAIKRWEPVFQALMSWNPIPLYQKLKARRYDLRLFAELRRLTWHIFAPKRGQQPTYGPGRAGMDIKVQAVKAMHNQRRRPYRLTFSSFAPVLPIRVTQIDVVVKALLQRLAQPGLRVALTPKQRRLFRTLRGKHSRKVAAWLISRFPRTAHVLNRYAKVYKIMEPTQGGRYRLDLRFRLNKRARPRRARKRRGPKGKMQFSLTFLDRPRGDQWLKWSYDATTRMHRIEGLLGGGGFLRCNANWKPTSKPWRPTQMGASWISHLRTSFLSPTIKVWISHIMFGWKVRKTPKGASLAMAMIHHPKFQIKGLSTVRTLARIFVPGGVENMVRHFLRNMAYGDRRKGLRWKWDFVEHPKASRVHFEVILPMVPDRKLTSILRMMPKPKPPKRARKRRARRKRGPSFWKRLHTAIFADLRAAQRVLAVSD